MPVLNYYSTAIDSQPVGTTIQSGSNIVLSVAATGFDSFQWFGPSGMLSDGGSVTGATTDMLTVANAMGSDSGDYFVRLTISSVSPVFNIDSDTVTVTVQIPSKHA